VVFFERCKVKCFFHDKVMFFEIGCDKVVCLFWFECDVDTSCFDHDECSSVWFEVRLYVPGKDVCLVSLGDILVDEVDRWDDGVVAFRVVRVCENRDNVGAGSTYFKQASGGDRRGFDCVDGAISEDVGNMAHSGSGRCP